MQRPHEFVEAELSEVLRVGRRQEVPAHGALAARRMQLVASSPSTSWAS
ncbi:MAG: hypothetical protein R3A52_17645 [Polyangiales bacterium]